MRQTHAQMHDRDQAETLVSATEIGAAGGCNGPATVRDATDDGRERRDHNTRSPVWRDAASSRCYTHTHIPLTDPSILPELLQAETAAGDHGWIDCMETLQGLETRARAPYLRPCASRAAWGHGLGVPQNQNQPPPANN